MNETIMALFENQSDAEHALHKLMEEGYDTQDFSVITRNGPQEVVEEQHPVADSTVSGVAAGGAIGALAGLLVGIGAITIPGIGAILIGGPIAAALGLGGAAAVTASGAITGALAGGIVGALVGIGVPEQTAKIYEERIGKGGILLAVSTDSKKDSIARNILQEYGAEEITSVAA